MENKSLIVAATIKPAELYSDKSNMQKVIDGVAVKARAIVSDATTPAGRKEIKSTGHKVARSKTLLDNMGKALTADMKKKTTAIDAIRKIGRDFLDDLKEEILQPVTDFEIEEEKRVKAEKIREKEMIEERLNRLAGFNSILPYSEVAGMTEEEFTGTILGAEKTWAREQERIAEEKRLNEELREKERLEKEETEKRLAKERAEVEKERLEIQKERDSIEKDKKALREAQEAEEKAKAEAVEAEEQAKLQIALNEQAAKDLADKAESDRIQKEKEDAEKEAMRPDAVKIVHWLQHCIDNIPMLPAFGNKVVQEDALEVLKEITNRLNFMIERYGKI